MYVRGIVSKLVLVGAVAAAQGAAGSSVYEHPSNSDLRIATSAMRQCPMPVHQPDLTGMRWVKIEFDTTRVIPMPTVRPGCYNPLGPAKSLDRPTTRLRQLEVKP